MDDFSVKVLLSPETLGELKVRYTLGLYEFLQFRLYVGFLRHSNSGCFLLHNSINSSAPLLENNVVSLALGS